jgi:hypothetical protein
MGHAERDLGRVQEARDALNGPSLSLSPAQDKLEILFEVLKAIGNNTDNVLMGGGFYSPEGFSSQTCN